MLFFDSSEAFVFMKAIDRTPWKKTAISKPAARQYQSSAQPLSQKSSRGYLQKKKLSQDIINTIGKETRSSKKQQIAITVQSANVQYSKIIDLNCVICYSFKFSWFSRHMKSGNALCVSSTKIIDSIRQDTIITVKSHLLSIIFEIISTIIRMMLYDTDKVHFGIETAGLSKA